MRLRLGSYGRFQIFLRWWRAPCSWFHLPKKRETQRSLLPSAGVKIKIYIHVSLDEFSKQNTEKNKFDVLFL